MVGCLLTTSIGRCELVTFQVVPEESAVTVTGSMVGNAAAPQGPGSLASRMTGTVVADVGPSTIRFTGGSLIDAQTNGTWQPLPGGSLGSAPADFAGQFSVPLLGLAYLALRDVELDVTSDMLALSAGSFAASGLLFLVPSNAPSALDYYIPSPFSPRTGREDLEGVSTNNVATTGSLSTTNGVQTLTLPLDTLFRQSIVNPNDSTIQIQGTIVARRSVPVPFRIESVTLAGSAIILQWSGEAGQAFWVEASADLMNWVPAATNLVPVGGIVQWSTNNGQAFQFFRVGR